MSGILVYALHYDGAFNKNSLGAVSEGAKLAQELGTECHAIVVGEGVSHATQARLLFSGGPEHEEDISRGVDERVSQPSSKA